jgi:DNA-binding transcriptional ArsR family regulator
VGPSRSSSTLSDHQADLAWIVGRDERLVSHHVRLLKGAGLARSERVGEMVMYELTERGRVLLAAVSSQELAR